MSQTADTQPSVARIALEQYMKEHNMRRTPERYAILERVIDMPRHFDIDDLCAKLDNDSFHVSKATVYNTMQLFHSAGIIRIHQFSGMRMTYELLLDNQHANHLHIICLSCGKIKEMKESVLGNTIASLQIRGFTPQYHTIYIYGLCSTCRRKSRKAHNTHVK